MESEGRATQRNKETAGSKKGARGEGWKREERQRSKETYRWIEEGSRVSVVLHRSRIWRERGCEERRRGGRDVEYLGRGRGEGGGGEAWAVFNAPGGGEGTRRGRRRGEGGGQGGVGGNAGATG